MAFGDNIKVESSNIYSVAYDEENEILRVTFKGSKGIGIGGIYDYFDVPPEVHEELMSADSHGKYLNVEIKHTYPYKRVN